MGLKDDGLSLKQRLENLRRMFADEDEKVNMSLDSQNIISNLR